MPRWSPPDIFAENGARYFAGPAISRLIAVGPNYLPSRSTNMLEADRGRVAKKRLLATIVGTRLGSRQRRTWVFHSRSARVEPA